PTRAPLPISLSPITHHPLPITHPLSPITYPLLYRLLQRLAQRRGVEIAAECRVLDGETAAAAAVDAELVEDCESLGEARDRLVDALPAVRGRTGIRCHASILECLICVRRSCRT